MKNNKTAYVNGVILTGEKDMTPITGHTILTSGDRIIDIQPADASTEGYEIIDLNGAYIMPGLINLHTHAYMTVLRNYADDVDFNEWLFKRVMPVEDSLPQEGAYWSSLLACMEMIRTGTTCFNDMHMFRGQSARAAADAGVRAFIGRGLVGEDLYVDGASRFEDCLTEQKEWQDSKLLKFVLAPHAIYSCSAKL